MVSPGVSVRPAISSSRPQRACLLGSGGRGSCPQDARLGGINKEHWAVVKALTRRVALRIDNHEYRSLMPLAELIDRLLSAVSSFLDVPTKWKWDSPAGNSDEAVAAIGRIRTKVYTALHSFAMERIVEHHLADWAQAYDYAGRGSSYDRASELRGIYAEAAPVPGVEFPEVASAFLGGVRQLVCRAIHEGGGDLVLQED